MKSKYRTEPQDARIKSAEAAGYKWQRDSDYKLGRGRNVRVRGCISILTGNVIGSNRAMIVYPDGSVETIAQKGNSSNVTFNRHKLEAALASHGLRPGYLRDEDDHFIESQQR
jgi:hypothetical protein